MARYHELIEKTGCSSTIEICANQTKSGTVNAVALYKHDVFTRGWKETQRPWRRIIDHFREFKTPSGRIYGENTISTIKTRSIVDFLNGKTANAQKNNLKAIRFLIRFAISQGDAADISRFAAPAMSWGQRRVTNPGPSH
jgi:hypothetical protein